MTRFDSIYVILMWSNKKLAFYKYLDAKVLEEKKGMQHHRFWCYYDCDWDHISRDFQQC
jgi:hypothetical protein